MKGVILMKLKIISIGLGLITSLYYMIIPAQASVLDEALEWQGHYYKVFELDMEWKDAEAFCRSIGGHLATIETSSEGTIIRRTVATGNNNNYWLGAYKDKIWKWVTGSAVTENWWFYGGPPCGGYMYFTLSKDDYKWYGSGETSRHGFICEWDAKENAHDSNW